jgi:hypothetical protein
MWIFCEFLPGKFLSENGGMSVMLEPSMRNSFSFCNPTTVGISLISDLRHFILLNTQNTKFSFTPKYIKVIALLLNIKFLYIKVD